MNIAIILYGQPRNYLKGYNNINTFINSHKNCKFNFFFHCWTLNVNESFQHTPARQIDSNDLIYSDKQLKIY